MTNMGGKGTFLEPAPTVIHIGFSLCECKKEITNWECEYNIQEQVSLVWPIVCPTTTAPCPA